MSSSAYGSNRVGFIWLLIAMLLVFVGWASVFEIDQAVRAQGQVIVGARTQIVQAFDGGVIKDIRVKEGQLVQQGELLAVLEQERSSAAANEIRSRLAAQEAALERLLAEATLSKPQFDKSLRDKWPDLVDAQRSLYTQKRTALDAELSTMDKALQLARDELDMHTRLYETGDVAKVEVMRIERDVIDMETRRRTVLDKYRSDARSELAKIEEEHSTLSYRLEDRENVLKHTKIISPMAGIVKYIHLTTEGGVLRQGDEFMQISPIDEELVIEVKINPADVGQLKIGLPATLRLDAFDSSIFGSLPGELIYVSPDTLIEQSNGAESGSVYYRAHIRLAWEDNEDSLIKIKPSDIKAGMTATVDIRTGSRTVLVFLLKPINKSFGGAFTER